jgi:BirA family biotin operon repressor/biotin-[acetyl-CoA-carboxylase] ligase
LNDRRRAPPTPIAATSPWRFERHATLGSTNDEARSRAQSGDAGRLWIVADAQTQGRGRRGRSWSSPKGNLYASALLIGPCDIAIAPQIGFVAGVALCRAVADVGATRARIKWPNDLVADGAKLAGLLVEGQTINPSQLAVIVGFGANVTSSPEGLAYPTTNLTRLIGAPVAAQDLFARLAERFDEALAIWSRGAGFPRIRQDWLAAAAGIGGPIRISTLRGDREGVFQGLDAQGRLLLRAGDAIETVESADLTLIAPPTATP